MNENTLRNRMDRLGISYRRRGRILLATVARTLSMCAAMASSSLTGLRRAAPAGALGTVAGSEFLRGFTGKESSDPRKMAGLILRLAGREDAPLRLPIGPDAVEYAGKAAEALAESDKKWLDVSLSTAYEQHPTSERSTG